MAVVDQGYIDPYGGRGLLSAGSGGALFDPGPGPDNSGIQNGMLALKGAGAAKKLYDMAKGGFDGLSFGGIGSSIANAGAGWAGSQLGTWEDGHLGSSIGGSIGGMLGSIGGIPGTFMGSAIGSALGSNFGPNPTVGPNAQAWLGSTGGRLGVLGASGDNGMNGSTMPGLLGNALNYANSFGPITGLPRHFQVRGGENKMDPTIELGSYMAPMMGDQSLARALAKRGYLNAPGIGEDPTRIFSGGKWLEPESIHPIWRIGVNEVQDAGGGQRHGFLGFGADSTMVQRAAQAMNGQYNQSLLGQYALDPVAFEQGRGIQSMAGQRTQSPLVEQTYGRTYETPTGGVIDALLRERGWTGNMEAY